MDQYDTEHRLTFTCTALSGLLNQEDENNVLQEVNHDERVGEVAGLPEPIAPDSDDEELEYSEQVNSCLLYTSPSPRDQRGSRMPSSA